MATFNPQTMARSQFVQSQVNVSQAPTPPAGTFVPGTKVQVGSHRVIIERYLSEGGFAHVYVVTLPRPIDGQEKAVLKRVAVPDKEHLANMRNEVETMKRLRGHKYIVKYIDSHASPLKSGGYEVFLLMEYCQGGGLIDFMNTRLQNRLTEPEILKIFTDAAEGVACMHYLKPPLLHRDLKVENILISLDGKQKIFKVCDFGSAAPPRPAATSAAEGRIIEDDVQRHTTMQYRSPEMVDVYRKQPIDEKSDIWALGVFLYKLCYYTTPFEEVGQMAILNASFKYPGYPRFSDQLKLLIASMLREHPSKRPNIYQVLQKASQMDGRALKIKDIYSERTSSEARKNQVLPSPPEAHTAAGATLSPPVQEQAQSIPDIAPMRRGRPSRPTSNVNSARPSPSPLRIVEGSDPFARLDGKKGATDDELSHKFPKLDQFSLLAENGTKFSFNTELSSRSKDETADLSQRVTHALADEAFARPSSPPKSKTSITQKLEPTSRSGFKEQFTQTTNSSENSKRPPITAQKPSMVSTGTMTSPPTSTTLPNSIPDRPIYRFPPSEKSNSDTATSQFTENRPQATSTKSGSRLASLLKEDAARSQQGNNPTQSSSSARPSMDGARADVLDSDDGLSRSRSLDMRVRPVSVNMGTGPTHIRDREIKKAHVDNLVMPEPSETVLVETDVPINSEMEFLRAREEEEKEKSRRMKRNSSGSRHSKRSSLPSMAISGTKNLLSGRFGDAFKKFEAQEDESALREARQKDSTDLLTPIAGSETTELSEDRTGFEETEDLSPEMRRELEKRQLEAEERRVADAAAAYRQRTGARTGPPPVSSKAAMIQRRVQSLLQDSDRPVQKTATGYGQFTDVPASPQSQLPQKSATLQSPGTVYPSRNPQSNVELSHSISAPASATNLQRLQRPIAPPKPRILQTGRQEHVSQVGVPDNPTVENTPAIPGDDWETQFSKKYPSLSHLEMVETDINTPQFSTREV